MRIGILASTAGSAFIEARKIIEACYPNQHQYFVVTDRECSIEEFCLDNNISCHRITYKNRKDFSFQAVNYFDSIGGVDVIMLYFLRIITTDLFTKYLCLNIHPALLPAFRGVNAVEQCLKEGVKFLGATLHLVDDGIDTGSIVAQIQTPIMIKCGEKTAHKISFLQKVYLTLVAIDLLKMNKIKFADDFSSFEWNYEPDYTSYANPCLKDSQMNIGFAELEKYENTYIIN